MRLATFWVVRGLGRRGRVLRRGEGWGRGRGVCASFCWGTLRVVMRTFWFLREGGVLEVVMRTSLLL